MAEQNAEHMKKAISRLASRLHDLARQADQSVGCAVQAARAVVIDSEADAS